MRRLYLLRHAKSDWSTEHDHDRERPLAPRGVKAAATVGRFLARLDQRPELVLSSPALRARETARLAAAAGGWSGAARVANELYETTPERVLEVIRRCDDRVARLLLVGHEPTWSLLAGALVGGGEVKLPTAAVARIDLAAEHWRDAAFGGGTLVWLVTPKLLRQLD